MKNITILTYVGWFFLIGSIIIKINNLQSFGWANGMALGLLSSSLLIQYRKKGN